MAHLRKRFITEHFQKLLKFWPVISLLGPRQSGKSTLLNDILPYGQKKQYVSLDKKALRTLANNNPEVFLNQFEIPLVIDEAHKAPDLFDEIKAVVDQNRRPGMYVLTGSVSFSKKVGIQESLTGRTAVLRMDTMTIHETLEKKKCQLKEIYKYMQFGGMPGVCFIRDSMQNEAYWLQWIDTVCNRDLKMFSKGKLSGDLAEEILEQCSILDHPDVASLAKNIGVDARRIQSHLLALEDLFAVRRVAPSEKGIGKDIFLPFDCGLASYYKANNRRLWQIFFLVHHINSTIFNSKKAPRIKYYLTSRHSFIDFVEDDTFHLYCDKPNPGRSETMTANAALKSNPKTKMNIYCATDSFDQIKHGHITWMSWANGIL